MDKMYLRDLLDLDEYSDMVEQGYINVRKHPEFDLYISGYSPSCQFEHKWNRSTMVCRGLITDSHDRVIARPWSKFFNLGEENLQVDFDTPVEITDKMDGSLGILYYLPDGTYAVSTRGSFESDQAVHATDIWKNKYAAYYDSTLHSEHAGEFTFLFEIVYPENRILLNYGDTDDLVLLGAVHTKQGFYYGPDAASALLGWYGPVTEVMPYNTISEALSHTDRPNAEGFVVRYHNYLVKLKQPDYVENHRLRFEMTPRRVWENLAAGRDLRSIVQPLPDEIQKEIIDIAEDLQTQAGTLLKEIYDKYAEATYINGRANQASFLRNYRHKGAVFTLLDDKDPMPYVWKQLRP